MRAKECVAVVLVAFLGVACGGSTTPAAATSPSTRSDQATSEYVALIRSYWQGIVTADGVVGNTNEAARACLGVATTSAEPNAAQVQPAACRQHAVALLAVQQKFLGDLSGVKPPQRFTSDDNVFRTQVPRAIDALNLLVSATASGRNQAVLDATNAYLNVMYASVLGALDDVDPSTQHG